MWPRWANVLLGVWLILSPRVLGYTQPSDQFFGVMITVASLIATRVRGFRYANVPLGLLVALTPFVSDDEARLTYLNEVLVGFLVMAFATIPARRRERPVEEAL